MYCIQALISTCLLIEFNLCKYVVFLCRKVYKKFNVRVCVRAIFLYIYVCFFRVWQFVCFGQGHTVLSMKKILFYFFHFLLLLLLMLWLVCVCVCVYHLFIVTIITMIATMDTWNKCRNSSHTTNFPKHLSIHPSICVLFFRILRLLLLPMPLYFIFISKEFWTVFTQKMTREKNTIQTILMKCDRECWIKCRSSFFVTENLHRNFPSFYLNPPTTFLWKVVFEKLCINTSHRENRE